MGQVVKQQTIRMPLAKHATGASMLNCGAHGTARWKQVVVKQVRLGKYSEITINYLLLKADLEQNAVKSLESTPITLMCR
jgi:hypothetical protein